MVVGQEHLPVRPLPAAHVRLVGEGIMLARAHARTGDAVAISAYLGKSSRFATALRDFARLYADQNERDHAQFERAIATGAVESAPGG